MLLTKFRVNWSFSSGEEVKKIDFQDGGHLGYPIGTILAIFDLQVTPMLPTKFRVSWLLGLGEKAKNRFSRWPPLPIGTILAIFDLQVTPMHPTKFGVIGLLVEENKRKNRFSRWRPWRPSMIFDRNHFSYF